MRDHASSTPTREAPAARTVVLAAERDAPEQAPSDASAQLFQRAPTATPPAPPAAPAASAGASDTPSAGVAEPGPFGVIVDDGLPLGAGQVSRDAFYARLAAEIERAADDVLRPAGYSTSDCPYLAHWLAFYRSQPAARLERAILHYARPARTDPEGLREAVLQRVGGAAREWLGTGDVDLPADLHPLGSDDRVPADARVRRKAEPGAAGATPALGAAVARARLGPGRPLAADTRARMERSFGHGFADVRVHDDAPAAGASAQLAARAFSVGDDVAFAAGQYRPGTLAGDLLLAHELAHTLQQRGSRARATSVGDDAALEDQADDAALDVLLGRTPSWTTGGALALRRCDGGTPAPRRPPKVIPLSEFIALVRRVEASSPGLNAEAIARRISRTKYAGRSWEWLLPSTAADVAVAAGGTVTADDVATLSHKLRVTLPGGGEADPLHIIVTLVARTETRAAGSGATGLARLVTPLPASVSQVEAASWVGDVGQAAAEWMGVGHIPGGPGALSATKDDYMTEFAPESDLMADVDGVAMTSSSAAAGFAFDPARPLSENLERFYAPTAARTGRSRRFHVFCAVEGFALDADGVTLSSAARAAIDLRVREFAVWFWTNDPGLAGLRMAAGHGGYDPIYSRMLSRSGDWAWFAQKFRDFVQRGLTAEGP